MHMAPCTSKQQHVVAVPLPAQGHLNPLMRFCKLLASHGVLVTFVNIDPVHHRLEELRQPEEDDPDADDDRGHHRLEELHQRADAVDAEDAAADGDDTSDVLNHGTLHVEPIRFAHIPIQGLDLASDFRVSFQPFYEAQNSIASPLEALIHQLNRQGPPVTCFLSDIAMTFPTQNVADKLNIPRVAFFPSSASGLLLLYYVTQGERISTTKVLEALTRRAESKEVICEGLTGLPTIYNNELAYFKHVVDDNPFIWEFFAKACRESLCHARTMAVNSFEELEGPALMALSKHLSLPIYGVGPLVEPLHKESSTSLWKEDEACILWLDQQPPLSVIYISFGSITLLSQPQFEEIVAGVLSSEQRFLWVFRPDLVNNIEYPISELVSRFHGKGYVVEWAPQLRVLSHPSVGGFLTHCGWNSTMEAIAHGVPMLCWPYFADQFLDAKYVVEEWKVGLQFEASKEGACLVERDEVERVMKALMQGEEGRVLRKNAMCLKEAGSQSLLPGGFSHKNIQSLIKSFM